MMHGPGRLINKVGHYKGDFQSNQRQGYGIYRYRNGDFYEGDWVNGMKAGHGRSYTKNDDRIYDGQFKNNQKHGAGKILTGDGHKVIEKGQWQNDVKQ